MHNTLFCGSRSSWSKFDMFDKQCSHHPGLDSDTSGSHLLHRSAGAISRCRHVLGEKPARNNCIWRQFSLIGQPIIVIALNSSLAGPECGMSGLWRELMNTALSSSCMEQLGHKQPLISETIVTPCTHSHSFALTVNCWWMYWCLKTNVLWNNSRRAMYVSRCSLFV